MPRCAKHDVLPFFYASIIMDKAGVIIATHGEEGGELDLPGFRFQVSGFSSRASWSMRGS
jgi:hypothetical protein